MTVTTTMILRPGAPRDRRRRARRRREEEEKEEMTGVLSGGPASTGASPPPPSRVWRGGSRLAMAALGVSLLACQGHAFVVVPTTTTTSRPPAAVAAASWGGRPATADPHPLPIISSSSWNLRRRGEDTSWALPASLLSRQDQYQPRGDDDDHNNPQEHNYSGGRRSSSSTTHPPPPRPYNHHQNHKDRAWVQPQHVNGTALREEDYLALKELVRKREPLKARALCLELLRAAERRHDPLSIHSYLTLMKSLGRAGDWEGAMGIFEALRGRHEGVGGKEFMKVIRVLARLGRYEEAMVYWEASEQLGLGPPSILDFNKLFDILGRAKQWPRCRALYEKMLALGVKPNKSTYQVLAHSAAVAAPWSEVLRVLDDATRDSCATNYVFTMALKGLKVRRNWKAAEALIGHMRVRWGILPDTVTYTAAISACERSSNCSAALSLLDLMKQDGAKPNHWTYSAAISACGHGRRLDEAGRLWDEMRASGLKPTLVVYNTMLSACERGKDLSRALALLEEMYKEGVGRDVITWNTIISVCKECGDWERAKALLDEMQEVDGIAPDTISYNAAIAACAKAGAVEEGRKLLVRMKANGVARDTCTYNSLMDGYTRAGSFPAVLQTLEQMHKEGPRAAPDVISYTQALTAAEKVGDYEGADRLLAAMKAAGVKWNQYTYAVVMALCEKTGRWPQAVKLLQAMRTRGLTPDSTCYTVVVKACASARKLGHCLALLQAMKDDGVTPTIHIYTILLGAAISADQLWTAVRLYQDMLLQGVRPNGVFVSAVIHALLESTDQPQKAKARAEVVLKRMEREARKEVDGLRLDLAEYHILLRAICRKGHLAFAQDILRHMDRVKDGARPDVTAYNYIMLGYAAQGNAAATSALASEMQRRGLEPNVFTFINLVRACAVAGCPERALAIVDPAFPWDFYSAAITIFHQYGCFAEADSLYATALRHGRVPIDFALLKDEHMLDLHGLSSPVASAAVRHALKQIRQQWLSCGPSAVYDLVLISGLGKGSLVRYSPTLRPLVQDLLVEQYYPPIDSTTQPGNAGRVVVSKESLLGWLEGKQEEKDGGGMVAGLMEEELGLEMEEEVVERAPRPPKKSRKGEGGKTRGN